jgi:hypothetical protein
MSSFAAPTPTIEPKLGWSLIPTGLDKRPCFKLLPRDANGTSSWKPFQTRRPTPREFESWLRANPPGFAIVTGSISKEVTFDFDGQTDVGSQKRGVFSLIGEREMTVSTGMCNILVCTSRP